MESIPFKRVGSIVPYFRPSIWAALSTGIILFSLKARLYYLDRLQREREVYLREQGYFYVIEHENNVKATK